MTGPARIWIPAEKNVPRPLLCEVCNSRFRIEQKDAFERHVIDCSVQHEEDERALSPRARGDVFSPSNGMVVDDLEMWVAKNRQAIIEGRLKM